MANEGRKKSNGSQFFFSLSENCRELEGRNTMFGRVVGDTVFNLLRMGDAELGEGDKPLFPTKITGAEVLVNPFDDMVRREVKRVEVSTEKEVKKKGMKKGGKTLLSFAGDDGGEEETVAVGKAKANPMLIDTNGTAEVKKSDPTPKAKQKDNSDFQQGPVPTKVAKSKRRRSSSPESPVRSKQPPPATQLPLPDEENPSRTPSASPERVAKMTTLLDYTNAQIADLKHSMKRTTEVAPVKGAKAKTALEMIIPANAVKGKKRKNGEKQTLALLNAFKSKLADAPAESINATPAGEGEDNRNNANINGAPNQSVNEEDEATLCDLHFIANCQSCLSWDTNPNADPSAPEPSVSDTEWMSHALSFEKDRLGKDLTWKKKNEDDLVVIDPREKAKGIKEDARAKKMARLEGSGTTAWAKDRDKGREPVRWEGKR